MNCHNSGFEESVVRNIEFFMILVLTLMALASFGCKKDSGTTAPPPIDTKPVVRIVTPTDNAVILSYADVEIEATDDKGVVRVEIFVDDHTDSSRVLYVKPYRWRWDVNPLPDSSPHALYAKAYDGDGNFSSSRVLTVTIVRFLPPSNLIVKTIMPDSLILQWQDNTRVETGFQIEQSSDGRNFSRVKGVDSNTTTATIPVKLTEPNEYFFRVQAITFTNSSGYSNRVHLFHGVGENLHVGGDFTSAGGVSASRVARWNGLAWAPLGDGLNGAVSALATFNAGLYVGGIFTRAGGNPASRIARWNGASWSPLGAGMNDQVLAMSVFNNEVYAGGLFTTAGGRSANKIARWTGTVWAPLDSGMNNAVNALAVYNNELYAGGSFTTTGDSSASRIAKWDGDSWSSVGTGVDAGVFCFAVFHNELYVGGGFTNAGGVSANRIAKWNGGSWSTVGAGVNGTAYALTVYNGDLYAGGSFANKIVRWDGTTWSTVGGGLGPPVRALAEYNGELYAALLTGSGIAHWNGVRWSTVGDGLNGFGNALGVFSGPAWRWESLP